MFELWVSLGYKLQMTKTGLSAIRHLEFVLFANNFHSIAARIIKFDLLSSAFAFGQFRVYIANIDIQYEGQSPSWINKNNSTARAVRVEANLPVYTLLMRSIAYDCQLNHSVENTWTLTP